nr:hypothetical protein Iba_chr01eCG5540 [Ipomoea batatas]
MKMLSCHLSTVHTEPHNLLLAHRCNPNRLMRKQALLSAIVNSATTLTKATTCEGHKQKRCDQLHPPQ